MNTHRLSPGEHFLRRCADGILGAASSRMPDLSGVVVVVPNLLLVPALRGAIAASAGRPLLLPQFVTLSGWVDPLLVDGYDTPARRQVRLFAALRDWRMLDGNSRWQVGDALIALFDELTAARASMPGEQAQLEQVLAIGYDTAIGEPLSFEARFVHSLWLADAAGLPSLPAARLAALNRLADSASAPLQVICEGEPQPDQRAFFEAYARHAQVDLYVPDRRVADSLVDSPLPMLNAAWPPEASDAALRDRAADARDRGAAPLAGRVFLVPTGSLEALARHAALQVRTWLAEGRSRIALIAADRVAARRTRALLERDDILVVDETGWKLSTTRAAALIDAWHEVIAGDGYHRALLDLLKSPFVVAGLDPASRARAIDAIELCLARRNIASGLDVLAANLATLEDSPGAVEARSLMRAVMGARAAFSQNAAEPAQWIARLHAALDALGASALLASDAAGADLLRLLECRSRELAGSAPRLSFSDWREWLDRQLEAATFRDSSIDSPVVMTHLAAARLRPFDAAIIIGADREHLAAGEPAAILSHDAVRRELGLPGRQAAVARLRDDLALLVAQSGEVCFAWQAASGDEACLPAVEVELLALAHKAAFQLDLLRAALSSNETVAAAGLAAQAQPAPRVPAAVVPQRISASGYQSLVACPYQYFTRHVLGLAEREDVSEELEKRDYGERVHGILARFHSRYPRITELDPLQALSALEQESREAFAGEIERNALELGWLERWLKLLPDYLAWQRTRESAGWHFLHAEQECRLPLELPDGAPLRIDGVIDRVDVNDEGGVSVIDYKTQSPSVLAAKLRLPGEDVQLAVYTILRGDQVQHAAYLSLDSEITARDLGEPQTAAADQYERLMVSFAAMRAGVPLPANGSASACRYCAARGLCRRDWFQ